MSNINSAISNEAVIPRIETRVFEGHEEASFALGILAVGNTVTEGLEEEHQGYLRLRANVYADQTRMISKDLVADDGTETDEDDSRSVHFGIIENTGDRTGRVVASMRLIIKSEEDPRPLPIENFYPEAFVEPAPIGSNEASRYISRHENSRVQESLSHPLFSAALAFIMTHGLRPTYGVVEPAVEASLRMKQIPIERIAEPKYVEEYADDNLGLIVDTDMLAKIMELRTPGVLAEMLSKEGELTYISGRAQRSSGAVA